MENQLQLEDIAPMVGMMELNILNLTKIVKMQRERIAELEAENARLEQKEADE